MFGETEIKSLLGNTTSKNLTVNRLLLAYAQSHKLYTLIAILSGIFWAATFVLYRPMSIRFISLDSSQRICNSYWVGAGITRNQEKAMFLEFLAALEKLAKEDRATLVEFVRRLGRTRQKVAAPNQGETSGRQAR